MARTTVFAGTHRRLHPNDCGHNARDGHSSAIRPIGGIRRRLALLLAAGLALFLLSSCAKKPAAPPPTAPAPTAPAPALPSRADAAYAEGAAFLKEGEYEQALDRFASAWKESPGHKGVARDFPEAVIGLKKSGDDAFRQGKGDEAGRKWTAALRATGHPAAKATALPFGKEDLRASIDRLTVSLMETALVDYRKGNLEAAIAAWRAVLSYDPANTEATKSVKTATTQLENFKKITVPKEPGH